MQELFLTISGDLLVVFVLGNCLHLCLFAIIIEGSLFNSKVAEMFSIKDVEKFQSLKMSESRLIKQQQTIESEIVRLHQSLESVRTEVSEVQERLNSEFRELNSHAYLFRTPEANSQDLVKPPLERTHYVNQEDKSRLFAQMCEDFRAVYPDADRIPFAWLKSHLAEKYGVQTQSAGIFFRDILRESELVGGTKNRAVKIR